MKAADPDLYYALTSSTDYNEVAQVVCLYLCKSVEDARCFIFGMQRELSHPRPFIASEKEEVLGIFDHVQSKFAKMSQVLEQGSSVRAPV